MGELYEQNLAYSSINTARSALSTVIVQEGEVTFGNHPLVTKFLRGVHSTRPSLPRYKDIWDVSAVLRHLKTLQPLNEISLKDLALKTTMLIALCSGQRCQTIQALDIKAMTLTNEHCTFYIHKLLKTSKPGKHFGRVHLESFTDKTSCVVSCIKEYTNRTKSLRGNNTQLLLSCCKPFKPVSTDTIGRWLKTVLNKAGVDTTVYSAHSTRSASTSAAKAANVPVEIIMKAAGWTNAETFRKFYDKPVTNDNSLSCILDNLS